MLELAVSKNAKKFLKKIPLKHQKQIVVKILELRKKGHDVHDSEKLKGYDYSRADVGEYRVVFEIEDNTLHVVLIGKRNDSDVYRKLSRKSKTVH